MAVTWRDEDDPPAPAFDINGFDPADFEWRPVLRRPRADGWTPEVQRRFIEALADTGLVSAAAEAVDMSASSAYRLRRAPGSEGFARAWDAALNHAVDQLTDIAFRRAIEGDEVPVFDRDGCRIGSKRRHNDRLLMFLLRAYRPDRFRHAHESVRGARETPPLAEMLVAQALASITPVAPSDPHRLMTPEQLENHVDIAQAMGNLYDCHPDLGREHFVRERIPDDHPAARTRAQERRERQAERGVRRQTRDDGIFDW